MREESPPDRPADDEQASGQSNCSVRAAKFKANDGPDKDPSSTPAEKGPLYVLLDLERQLRAEKRTNLRAQRSASKSAKMESKIGKR